ncbi:MAG: hypothetical protein AB7T20_08305 [Steroidobacteraceae bacterium]
MGAGLGLGADVAKFAGIAVTTFAVTAAARRINFSAGRERTAGAAARTHAADAAGTTAIADATGAIISCFSAAAVAGIVTCAVTANSQETSRFTKATAFAGAAGTSVAAGIATYGDCAGAIDTVS